MSAIDHVRELAGTIGLRGSTGPGERAAADYALDALKRFGLQPTVERFRSGRSAWAPYSIFWGAVIASGALFLSAGQIGAIAGLALSTAALGSILLEMLFRPNPIRLLLPWGRSQNVWAEIAPCEEVRERVVLVAHLDTHRTPLFFSTDGWVRLFGRLVPIGLVCTVSLVALFALGIPYAWPAIRFVAIPLLLVTLGMLGLTLQADLTPYTAGANDNASGVAVVLNLAKRFAEAPLRQTSIYAVLTGCEEVGCYGADAFLRAHRHELAGAVWIPIDTVGSRDADPVYLKAERFLATTRSDPDLVRLADEICANHPEWRVRSVHTAGGYTEGVMGAKYGQRVLTIGSQTRSGILSEWHRPTDTVQNVSEETLVATESFVWELLADLDARAART